MNAAARKEDDKMAAMVRRREREKFLTEKTGRECGKFDQRHIIKIGERVKPANTFDQMFVKNYSFILIHI